MSRKDFVALSLVGALCSDVRFGSKADMSCRKIHVRYSPGSGHPDRCYL
jgi:hypothetical protein